MKLGKNKGRAEMEEERGKEEKEKEMDGKKDRLREWKVVHERDGEEIMQKKGEVKMEKVRKKGQHESRGECRDWMVIGMKDCTENENKRMLRRLC